MLPYGFNIIRKDKPTDDRGVVIAIRDDMQLNAVLSQSTDTN